MALRSKRARQRERGDCIALKWEQEMAAKQENEFKKDAVESPVRITVLYPTDVDMEVQFGLCKEHLKKA